ncbi:MAG: hypothetical protein K2Z81_26325, partial [Cyanobacteria bacterium]|nr:hypothetical protein [Cyanobacteriota bacterium]
MRSVTPLPMERTALKLRGERVNDRATTKQESSYLAIVKQMLLILLNRTGYPSLVRDLAEPLAGGLSNHLTSCITLLLRFVALHLVSQSRDLSGEEHSSLEFDELSTEFWKQFESDTGSSISSPPLDFGEHLEELVRLIRLSDSSPEQSLSDIYEALLTMKPCLFTDENGQAKIDIVSLDKSQRRRGSFYSPVILVEQLVSSSITPFLYEDGKLRPPVEVASLRILDPSMGTGAFLIEAYKVVVRALENSLDTHGVSAKGLLQLLESDSRTMYEYVARHCLYGVDIDPAAVEVARLRLWLVSAATSFEPEKIRLNLRNGNSLVGARPDCISTSWSSGDKKTTRSGARRATAIQQKDSVCSEIAKRAKQSASRQKDLMNLWCARWFMDQDDEVDSVFGSFQPSQDASPEIPDWLKQRVSALEHRHKFFHWQIEFEHVFAKGGFDLVIGNPPWEIEKPNSREFFGFVDPQFWSLGKQDALKRQAELLSHCPRLSESWQQRQKDHSFLVNWVKNSPIQFGSESRPFRYQGRGDANLYKLFIEQSYYLVREGGRVALIVPSGLYSDCGTQELRNLLLTECEWNRLQGFYNTDGAFDIHRSFRFCLFVATRGGITEELNASFVNTCASIKFRENAAGSKFALLPANGKSSSDKRSKSRP